MPLRQGHRTRSRGPSLVTEVRSDGRRMTLVSEDGLRQEVEFVSETTNESFFSRHAPILPACLAYLCAFLNIVPGLGTILAAFSALCCSSAAPEKPAKEFAVQLLAAVLQILLTPIIVGLIWSISYGFVLIRRAERQQEQRTNSESVGLN